MQWWRARVRSARLGWCRDPEPRDHPCASRGRRGSRPHYRTPQDRRKTGTNHHFIQPHPKLLPYNENYLVKLEALPTFMPEDPDFSVGRSLGSRGGRNTRDREGVEWLFASPSRLFPT